MTPPRGLLNEVEILRRLTRLDDSCLIITPIISVRDQLGPSSFDLRLGSEFLITRHQRYASLELLQSRERRRYDAKRYTEAISIRPDPALDAFILHPGEFVLGSSLEFVALPNDLAAWVEGRSSLGRLGVQVHSTAGFIEPGFRGCVTFELSNSGKLPVPLNVGLRVAQLAFEPVTPSHLPYGSKIGAKYREQLTTTGTRIYEDRELDVLWALRQRESGA